MAYDSTKRKAYYEANKEKIKVKGKIYREANREKIRAYAKTYRKTYYKANKEKIKSQALEYKYNITLKEKNIMLKKQKNKCKICNIKFSKTRSCVDHCHTTNKVRGILCNLCNVGLGHFKDSTEILTNAIDYLEEAV